MRKKILLIVLLLSTFATVYALTNKFVFDTSKLSISSNKNNILSNFNNNYGLSYSISNEQSEEEKEIENLTKKTTYLLFGDGDITDESSENFYNRKQEFYSLRYNPEVPKDDSTFLGLDMNSQEYKDDLISGMAIPQIFSQATDLGMKYDNYGNIRISFGNNIVFSTITLFNAKIKSESKTNPMEFEYKVVNFTMYYYYKKLDGEWKLYYLYGEVNNELLNYIDEASSLESSTKSIEPYSESKLSSIYNFDKAKNLSQSKIDNIYNKNQSVVYLTSYYNNMEVASSNGFFIKEGLLVTTWNFIEKSLSNAQYIVIRNKNDVYEMEGIVTANPNSDIVVIKVKNTNLSPLKIGDYTRYDIEDAILSLSSKVGTGFTVQTGIIITLDDYIQTSIPLSSSEEGSPLFSENGEVIGMYTSLSTNSSISVAINSDALKEVQDKFNSINYGDIETISFEELKEKYYYSKYNEEVITNSIPKSKWSIYSKIGDIEKNIKLQLVKASYKDGIVSLRYKNSISKFFSNMQLSASFKDALIKEGYNEVVSNSSKAIYKNSKYQVIIMDEFDYLIIVMVKL